MQEDGGRGREGDSEGGEEGDGSPQKKSRALIAMKKKKTLS